MDLPRIIGLVGRAGAGKTTLAEMLTNEGYIRTPLADPIKTMIGALLRYQVVDDDTIDRMLYGDMKEEPSPFLSGKSARVAMQTLGTEWRDLISPDLWLDIWQRRMNYSWMNAAPLVVDDVRFVHEANRIQELGGAIFMVVRSGTETATPHASEAQWVHINADATIVNSETDPERMLDQVMDYFARA